MEVNRDHFHAAGALHGSAYFKLLDDACFFAVSSRVSVVFVLTVSLTTYQTRTVTGGRRKAVGRVVHPGRSLLLAEAVVALEHGSEVGRGRGAFMKSSITLTPEPGYREQEGYFGRGQAAYARRESHPQRMNCGMSAA